MNNSLANYAREKIKEGLMNLSKGNIKVFKRLYSVDNLELPIDNVIKNIPDEKLNRALTQVQNTLKKMEVK